MSFKLGKIKARTTTNLETKLTNRIQQIIENRVGRLQDQTEAAVKTILIDFIQKNRVYKGLDGQFAGSIDGSDLQAEFGLPDSEAEKALAELIGILVDTVHITVSKELSKNNRSAGVEITIKVLDPEEYEREILGSSSFSYVSYGHVEDTESYLEDDNDIIGTKIEWMNWLLNAATDILDGVEGLKNYGILYNLNGKQEAYSRSGRALMVSDSNYNSAEVNFPYVLPRLCIPKSGAKNFIDEISKNKEFKEQVKDLISKKISSILKSG